MAAAILYGGVRSGGFAACAFLLLLLLSYSLIRLLLGLLFMLLPISLPRLSGRSGNRKITQVSRLSGAVIGLATGLVRALLLVFALYIGVGLNPDSTFSRYVESSPIYRQSASAVFEPLTGENVRSKLPVLTKAVAAEMTDILRRKYEVLDHEISPDIVGAASDIAGQAGDDEKKARLLYDWVGSRISYDYAKAENYEQNRIWKEQTPQDTFDTRIGVCIDYARLYAVMARSQGLQVRVVTGQGYDGQGDPAPMPGMKCTSRTGRPGSHSIPPGQSAGIGLIPRISIKPMSKKVCSEQGSGMP